jgi:RNA recognition motif-containing protein
LIDVLDCSCNPEHKLFVGMLPKNVSETEVQSLFSEYGTIKDLQILRGSLQTSKGCLFLKYESKEQAVAAMEALNGRHIMEVCAYYIYFSRTFLLFYKDLYGECDNITFFFSSFREQMFL